MDNLVLAFAIIGILGAFGMIAMSISQPSAFIDTPSMLIVVAGSIMVVLFRLTYYNFLILILIANI